MTLSITRLPDDVVNTIKQRHYLHRLPRGKSHAFKIDGALVVFSVPANANVVKFLLGKDPVRPCTPRARGGRPAIMKPGWVMGMPNGRWRARPFWKIAAGEYRLMHLGYFDTRRQALAICAEWHDLALELGADQAGRIVNAGCPVWELSRLFAPEDHEPNLLTRAISSAIADFRDLEPNVEALISYADPDQEHHGGVYRAASWLPCGQTSKSAWYADADGKLLYERPAYPGPRRLNKAECDARGWRIVYRPGKLRFAFGLTREARLTIAARFL